MLCVLILYISGGDYSLKSTPNDRVFEKLYMPILFTLRVFARILLRGNHRRNTFRISFWCPAWDSNPGFSSNKPTYYLLDHGDFECTLYTNKKWSHSRVFEKARAGTFYFKNVRYTDCVGLNRARQSRRRVVVIQSVLCEDAFRVKRMIVV